MYVYIIVTEKAAIEIASCVLCHPVLIISYKDVLTFFVCFCFIQTKIANLLGVAGTDVPVRDIKKLLSPFLVSHNKLNIEIEANVALIIN